MATDLLDVSRRQFVLGLGAGLSVGGGGVAAYQTLKQAAPASDFVATTPGAPLRASPGLHL